MPVSSTPFLVELLFKFYIITENFPGVCMVFPATFSAP